MKKRAEYETIDIPHRFADLAERRTAFLFHVMRFGNQTIQSILSSAYLQGVQDGAVAMEKHGAAGAKPSSPIPHHC